MKIWQSCKQERGCLMHFARLANTLLKDEESTRDNNVFACNFANYSPIKKIALEKLSSAFGLALLFQGIGALAGPPLAGLSIQPRSARI